MLEQEIKGRNKQYFGIRKASYKRVYIYKPVWNCGWYFGYLGNKHEIYNLNRYKNKGMYDVLNEDYKLNKNIKKHLKLFCELATIADILIQTVYLLDRGWSHYIDNPLKDIIQNKAEAKRIDTIILPAIFNKINDIYEDKIESA